MPRGRAGVGDDDAESVPLLPERPVDPGGKGTFRDGEPLPAGDPDGIDRDGGDAQVGEEVAGALADLALARAHFFFGSSRSSSASTTRTAWSMVSADASERRRNVAWTRSSRSSI